MLFHLKLLRAWIFEFWVMLFIDFMWPRNMNSRRVRFALNLGTTKFISKWPWKRLILFDMEQRCYFLWKWNLILVHKTVLFGFKSDRYVKCVFELQQYNNENINCIFFIIFCMSDLLSVWQGIWYDEKNMSFSKDFSNLRNGLRNCRESTHRGTTRFYSLWIHVDNDITSTMISSWNIWRYFSATYQIFCE